MSTDTKNPTAEELAEDQEAAQVLAEQLGEGLIRLSPDEEKYLSKVLFPESDPTPLEVLGIERIIHPLPLKYTKQIGALVRPYAKILQKAMMTGDDKEDVVNTDAAQVIGSAEEDVVAALSEAVKVMATHYKWSDVVTAVQEEELSLTDLQSLATRQLEANGHNDFLLGPLRTLILVMQVYEMMSLRFRSLLTTRLSQKSGVAP